MSEELDDIGRETAAMMKTMLQIATLVALKARERGQKEAEARVKVTQARMKEQRELQIREARDSKAKDPRNTELSRMMVDRPLERKGVSLDKDRSMDQSRIGAAAAASAKPVIRYDSPERRMAIAAHLAKAGVAPELAAVRMLAEVGQAKPLTALQERSQEPPMVTRAREMEERARARAQALERARTR
ncbi:hypothetical protein [Nocardia callitridis]|uniref:Uncharacterized protein n=1 Tax=Nocardia callitridis TaxID=648753 RepID=A0ABP9K9F9_9NOCA